MCGIAGFICAPGHGFDEQVIRDSLNVLKQRGPDGTSWLGLGIDGTQHWTAEADFKSTRKLQLAFGCSRLALLDVSDAGLQPIKSSNGRIWAALNGEVFNYIELREELKELGARFETGTDTEVVANAFAQWGTKCFGRLNGQFGIAIYDADNGRLILARDRIGITPLYVCKTATGILFGSEIKALRKNPEFTSRPNNGQLAALLGLPYKLHYNPSATLFEGVEPVPPGSYIEFDLTTLKSRQEHYWRADEIEVQDGLSFTDCKERLRELLIDSVRLRLRTDRKFAFLVSGGVDSPSVLGIAKKLLGVDPVIFSLGLPDKRFNEDGSIREVLEFLNLNENFIPVNPKAIQDILADVIDYSDEPLATPNAVLHGIMSRAINDTGTKVVLNGVGGDEVFFGYHDHFLYHLHTLKQAGHPSFESELQAWHKNQNRPLSLFEDFEQFIESGAARHSPDFLARSRGFDYRILLKDDFRTEHLHEKTLFAVDDFSASGKHVQDLTRLTIPHSIRMDDNCYLSQAVEARQPFLDHRLVELGLSMPTTFKVRRSVNKFVLRQAVRGLIPDTRRRDTNKIGLNLPIDTWMRGPLKGWVEEHLRSPQSPLYQYADYENTQTILQQHFDEKANHCLKIWDLCCANNWLSRI